MPNLGKVNILLVDDRPEGIFTLETVLKDDQYRLVTANSGEEALKCMLNEDFALVLLDVQMPGMDGFETAKLIRERKRSRFVPIIFVTAITKEENFITRGYESGAVDYIFKPFNPDILRSKVQVFVELFTAKRQIEHQSKLIDIQRQKEKDEEVLKTRLENLERYENLANSVPHMVWRATPDKNIEYFNKVWCDYTKLTPEESAAGKWQKHLNKIDLKKLQCAWDKAISSGEDHFEIELQIKDYNGRYEWYWVKALAEKNKQGETLCWIGTNTSIKEKKELDQNKASFLSIASHELKTPLTAIKTSLEATSFILGEDNLDEEHLKKVQQFIDIGNDSSERLDELLEEFLDFSRVESARLTIKPARECLSEVVMKSIESYRPKIEKTGRLKLKCHIEDGIFGLFDRPRVRQVVDNLLGNAIKYTPGNGSIEIKLGRGEAGLAEIAIRDEGIGMEEEEMKGIFKPFKRAYTSEAIGGLGIGLYISSWIIEEHQGEINVTSEKGKGSTFRIKLPIMDER